MISEWIDDVSDDDVIDSEGSDDVTSGDDEDEEEEEEEETELNENNNENECLL